MSQRTTSLPDSLLSVQATKIATPGQQTSDEPEPPSERSMMPSSWDLPRRCKKCGARYPADFQVCPRDASRLEDITASFDDPLLGVTIGGTYHVQRLLGEGGMARVYEARHERLPERRFAVKVLHDVFARNPDVVTRFQREARAASAISHPNVVEVYDVHRTPEGMPYLVCELLEGRDLYALLEERGRLDVGLAVYIVRQVCKGLAAAHERGVVHRDMKPGNVFLAGNPTFPDVKVLDFGISKVNVEGTELTRTGMIMGTPGYMPPEQATTAKVTHLADIYSVGAMLYRTLTGRAPFEAEDTAELLRALLTMDPPRPRSLEPSIPEALEVIIQRAMAREAEHRYSSMEELDAALAPFDSQARLSSVRPPALGEATDPGRRLALVQAARGRQSALDRATKEARGARPSIVLCSVLIFGTLIAAGLEASSSIWALSVSRPPTHDEGLLLLGIVAAIVLVPLLLWIRHVYRHVWRNTVLAVETALTGRRLLIAAAGTYAFASLLSRSLRDLALVPIPEVLDPLRRLVLLAVAALAMLAAYAVTRWGRAKRMAGA